MKRISTILLFLLLATTLKAQNLVSTDPYKRNVIIEEYTGVYCGYCPDGHKIANELTAEYQDRLFVLNIHAGSYANDASIDFRTEDGNIIFSGAKASSFPSGNVNRVANKAVSRDLWRSYVEQQVEQMAECNVAGQVIIDKVCEAVRLAGSNPCPPLVVGVGIGGDFEQVAFLAKKALCRAVSQQHEDAYYAELEQDILQAINRLDIGPQGFGGETTALAVNIEVAPTHIAGLPLAINIGCHVTRHATACI